MAVIAVPGEFVVLNCISPGESLVLASASEWAVRCSDNDVG